MALNERQQQIISDYQKKGGSALFFEALPYPVRYDLVESASHINFKNICFDVTGCLQGRELT